MRRSIDFRNIPARGAPASTPGGGSLSVLFSPSALAPAVRLRAAAGTALVMESATQSAAAALPKNTDHGGWPYA
jgi:hypothetical protein